MLFYLLPLVSNLQPHPIYIRWDYLYRIYNMVIFDSLNHIRHHRYCFHHHIAHSLEDYRCRKRLFPLLLPVRMQQQAKAMVDSLTHPLIDKFILNITQKVRTFYCYFLFFSKRLIRLNRQQQKLIYFFQQYRCTLAKCFEIWKIQIIMESDNESKEEIGLSTQYISLSLKTQPQITKKLLMLITGEVALELESIHPQINERLRSAFQELIIQLRVDLRKMQKLQLERTESEQIAALEIKTREQLSRLAKLKEISLYFNHLHKQASTLQKDVEKFLFYQPRSDKLQEKLEQFFSSPLVSQLFLKEYEKSFNMNNFTADLISFFYFLHQNNLLQSPEPEVYSPIRNKDLQLIENNNVIFRQICDINDKYANVQEQLKHAYVHLRFVNPPPQEEDFKKNKFQSEEAVIQKKYQHLQTIFNKIKSIYGGVEFNSLDGQTKTLLLPEEPKVFGALDQAFNFHCPTRNQEFLAFLQGLYDPNIAQGLQEPGIVPHFDFLRQKIIRAQTRWHLNRIISAFNVGSHIFNQVQSDLSLTHHHYTFSTPYSLAKYQFNSTRVGFYTVQPALLDELFVLNRNVLVTKREEGYMLRLQKNEVIYPSAVNNYLYFLKFIYALSNVLQEKGLYSQETMLQILQIKADEMMEWAEIVLNLYDIIKNKYYRCYNIFQEYVSLIFKIHYTQQLDFLQRTLKNGAQGISNLLCRFVSKQRKAGCISQIIFQLETSYDIREALLQLRNIEQGHRLSFYASDSPQFYERILNEIIQTKNNLKFDRCLSFNTLHQTFGFLAARPNDLKDLAQQLTPLSHNKLRLPDLLRFYSTQTRLKREVFKAELYWITIAQPSVKSKFIVNSQRKKASFRDFLDQNAKNILCLTDKPLAYFLTNLQEFERSVLLFGQEVDRLKLIQCSLLYLKPDFALEDHLSAFSHKQLSTFFNYCTHFNLIQDLYIRREKKNWILSNIRKLINSGNKLKFCDLALDPILVSMKQQLASYIFFLAAFEHHYNFQECINLINKVVLSGQPPEYVLKLQILRSKRDLLKQYEQCQFMDATSLAELTQIYQLILLISINNLLKNKLIDTKDVILFKQIRNQLPSYESFKAIDNLQALQAVKEVSCISSRSHSLAALKTVLSFYKQSRQKNRKTVTQWYALQSLGIIADIGIVSRRLFCNEVVETKRLVSADQWKNFNKTTCLSNLRLQLDNGIIEHINEFMKNWLDKQSLLDPTRPLNENLLVLQQRFKNQVIIQYDLKYSLQAVKRESIVLFDQLRGYQVQIREKQQQNKTSAVRYGRGQRTNFKRGLLNTLKREDQGSTQIINQLQHRINLEIVKQSLPMRKLIYQLQLQGKRIRDQISWQTCKLQHNVITKINKFIEESTLDQKQSLINFKYTVNLETIKGIENVISERAAIFLKNSQQQLMQLTSNNGFITQPQAQKKEQKKQKDKAIEQETLLDINVRNIFNHVKKLRIFWAWKNIHLRRQSNEGEWIKFSENVERILHNKDNLKRMQHLQQLRYDCNRHEIVCNLIKEENVLLNDSIKRMKVNNLTKKLNSFKDKHSLAVEENNDI